MSAALQIREIWGTAGTEVACNEATKTRQQNNAPVAAPTRSPQPDASLAFYRKHTESMLQRYLYASMLVGRTPELLSNSVGRGWISSRPVRSFEDAVIFVLDVETCLRKLNALDRKLLTCIVLQDYTHAEAAEIIGMGVRTVSYKFPQAVDRLTRLLLDAALLVLPY